MPVADAPDRAVRWIGGTGGHLRLLDQTKLPTELTFLDCRDVDAVWHAIKRLSVRGAPAIGVAAAYGVVLAAGEGHEAVLAACDHLATSRPTAVNLFWALDRMRRVAEAGGGADATLGEAHAILEEDLAMCRAIGEHGADLLAGGVLTHCNAGALATSDFGTALSVIFHAHAAGRDIHVYADETRPLLQGSRLTMWELMRRGVPATLICDNTAAQVMKEGRIDAVVVGSDRIAANGDVANKIGTYGVAVLAKHHGIPFYVAAPSSTFDAALPTGDRIPIEQRDPTEVTRGFGRQTAPEGAEVYSPAFDVTPAELVTAIVTERGVHRPPYGRSLAALAAAEPAVAVR